MNVASYKWRTRLLPAIFILAPHWALCGQLDDMVLIKTGDYSPLFVEEGQSKSVTVEAFYLDKYGVTNQQFEAFTQQYPQWGASQIKPIFADSQYLHLWQETHASGFDRQPVTYVSWFAARAYCKAQGKRLPSIDEWEYAGSASETNPNGSREPEFRQRLLEWYSKPAILKLPAVDETERNYWGVYGMHGVVWELVSNFNSNLVTGESRADSSLENNLFCGAGAAGSVDPSDYAAFMRYAMRSSLEGNYTMRTLGFRCAKDVDIAVKKDQP